MGKSSGRFKILPDQMALARHVAEWMTLTALAAKGPFRVSLSGSKVTNLPPGTGFLPPETGAQKAPQRRYLRTETGNRRPPRARNGRKSPLRACRS